MNKEERDKVLEELQQVEPSHLNDNSLRLFNAIMSIADERDLFKNKIDKAIEYIEEHNIIVETETIRTNSFELLEILKGDSNE